MVPKISVKELKLLLDSQAKPFILDVRERENFEDYHISGSLSVPYFLIEGRYEELPRDQLIVVICQNGRKSQYVTLFLLNKGYKKVRNLIGGIKSWLALTSC